MLARITAVLAAATLALTACGAGGSSKQNEGSNGKDNGTNKTAVTVGLTAAPANLDFTTTSGAAIPQALMTNVYQGLVTVDQNGDLKPLLAESWDVSKDRTEYTFTLREGVTFSNGTNFTAKTAKFSLERVQSDAWKNGLKTGMDVVKKVEAIDDTTLKVTLKHPSKAWLWDMATLIGAQFAPDGVDNLATKPVGTGPFTVTKWDNGRSLTLEAREDYWGEKPASKKVTLRYFSDATTAANALKTGSVDAIPEFQAPDLIPSYEKNPKFKVQRGTTTSKVMLAMNNKKPPFNNLKARKAIMYGVNRQAVLDSAWGGYGDLLGAPVPPTDPYYEDLSGEYPYDPEKAAKLVEEAGLKGETVTIATPSRPYATAAAQVIVSDLKKIGLNAKIEQQEFPAVWLDKTYTKGNYTLSVIAHVEPKDLLNLVRGDYYFGYDDSRIAELRESADTAGDEEWVKLTKELVRKVFIEDAAANTLFLMAGITVMAADIEGMPENTPTTALDLTKVHHN